MVTPWPDPAATTLLAQLVEHLDQDLVHARALRRELHRHPDLSGAERPTAERLRHALPNLRATRVADTGFMVRVGPPGPAVAIRAELDALPLVEHTGVEWASTNGAMHACGHDVHLAALWLLLQAARRVDKLPVGLVALFQPREETQPSGAEDVVTSQLLSEQRGVRRDRRPRAAAGARRGDQHRRRSCQRCGRPVRHRRARRTGARRLPARRDRPDPDPRHHRHRTPGAGEPDHRPDPPRGDHGGTHGGRHGAQHHSRERVAARRDPHHVRVRPHPPARSDPAPRRAHRRRARRTRRGEPDRRRPGAEQRPPPGARWSTRC